MATRDDLRQAVQNIVNITARVLPILKQPDYAQEVEALNKAFTDLGAALPPNNP